MTAAIVAKLDELIGATPAPDYEIITTGWLCDEGGTDNWIRTETPYVNGVAGTPVVIDSGIDCSDPVPTDVIEVDVELVCNAATGFYDEYRVITTNGVAAAPVITATTISCAQVESQQAIPMPDTCVTVDGTDAQHATPVVVFNQATGLYVRTDWYDSAGSPITGVVVETDPCDCPCLDCGDFLACTLVRLFDVTTFGALVATDSNAFEISTQAGVQATIAHDYLTTADSVGKASWYTPVMAAINALPNWTITLVSDVADDNSDVEHKPQWQINYSGPGSEFLRIEKANTVGGLGSDDAYLLTVDAAGALTTEVVSSGGPLQPDYNSAVYSACP